MPINATITLPKTESGNPGAVNAAILLEELLHRDPPLTQTPQAVRHSGTDVLIDFVAPIEDSDESAALETLRAHAGAPFAAPNQAGAAAETRFGQVPEVTAQTDAWVEAFAGDFGPLAAGKYEILYTAEHRITGATETLTVKLGDDSPRAITVPTGELCEVRAILVDPPAAEVPVHGENPLECNNDASAVDSWLLFSAGMTPTIVAGENIKVRVQVRKVGTGSAVAAIRRVRVKLVQIA